MADTTRWTAEPPEYDVRQGWWLRDDQRWDDRFINPGMTEEQAHYAANLLNAGGLGDDDGLDLADWEAMIEEAVLYTNCVSCEATFMQAELDSSKRCTECQS